MSHIPIPVASSAVSCVLSPDAQVENDPVDTAGSISTQSIDYTCSLFSSRMSTNQTCDDLPGPGRTIDTYFYQPAGRLLERALNRFVAQMNTKWIYREISEASDAIVASFDSTLPHCHGDFSVEYRYWKGHYVVTERISLSALLFMWGGQNLEGYDDTCIKKQCKIIASFVGSPHSVAQQAAAKSIVRLLDRYPRLRVYFNIPAICRELRGSNRHQVFADIFWILSDYQSGRQQIDSLLYELVMNLPAARITRGNLSLFRPSLLSFIRGSLESLGAFRCEGGIFLYEFRHLLGQLFSIEDLFHFQNLQYHDADPIKLFWEKLATAESDEQSMPMFLTQDIRNHLQRCLIKTWATAPPSDDPTENINHFARVALFLFFKFFTCARSRNSPSDNSVQNLAQLKMLVMEKAGMKKADVEFIWDELHTQNFPGT